MKVIVLILFMSFSSLFAQNVLSGKINCECKMVNLSKYYFNDKTHIDTVNINEKGLFKKDITNLEPGEYNLKNEYIDIDFIYNKESIILEDNCDENSPVIFKNSLENNLLNHYFEFYYENNTSYGLLNRLLDYYPKTDSFYKDIERKVTELNENNDNYIDSLKSNYSNTLVSKITDLYHYSSTGFVNNDIKYDEKLIKTRFLGELTISYLNTYNKKNYNKEEQEKAYFSAIDTILHAFKKNELLTLYVADFLIEKFRMYDLDMSYEYTAIKAKQLLDFNKFDVKNKDIAEIVFNINNIVNSTVGKKAYNFKIPEKGKLYDVKAKQKLVIFWASWCPHCEETIKDLKENLIQISPETQVIAYSLDFKESEWNNAISDFPKNWINICECQNSENVPDKYSVYATPTLFLLDSENTIIAKPRTYLELLDYIDNE